VSTDSDGMPIAPADVVETARRLIAEVYGEFVSHHYIQCGVPPVDGSKDTRWMREAKMFLDDTVPTAPPAQEPAATSDIFCEGCMLGPGIGTHTCQPAAPAQPETELADIAAKYSHFVETRQMHLRDAIEAALVDLSRQYEEHRESCKSPDYLECDNIHGHPRICHCNDPVYWKQRAEAAESAARDAGAKQWIPVSERMPESWAIVVCNGHVQRQAARLTYTSDTGEVWEWADEEADCAPREVVTHWQPLPEPPAAKLRKLAEETK